MKSFDSSRNLAELMKVWDTLPPAKRRLLLAAAKILREREKALQN